MTQILKKIYHYLSEHLWQLDTSPLSRLQRFFLYSYRLIYCVIHEMIEGQITLRAMGLVYMTIFAIVPLLAVSFSVLKGFGVHNQLEPLLLNFLAPLGERGIQITSNIITFVDNMKVGVLGSIGFVLLFVTVISLVHRVESAFNYIWRIRSTGNFIRKFTAYLSVILIGPVLLFAALGLTASMTSQTLVAKLLTIEPFGTIYYLVGQIMPYLLIIVAFTFFYLFIPNTKVNIKSALIGGTIAGLIWKLMGWGFSIAIASMTRYDAIYSSFSIMIFLLIWIYLNWLLLLVGAQITHFHQNMSAIQFVPGYRKLSHDADERLILILLTMIAKQYHEGKRYCTIDGLSNQLKIDISFVDNNIYLLLDNGFILQTTDDPPGFIPSRDMENILIKDVYQMIRCNDSPNPDFHQQIKSLPKLEKLFTDLKENQNKVFNTITLRELI